MEDNKQQYWIGPADVKIPNDIIIVPGMEDDTIVWKDGRVQHATSPTFCAESMSEDQYRMTWAKNVDGVWYWKYKMIKNSVWINEEENYWIGPANVRIPLDVDKVPGLPHSMFVYKNGTCDTSVSSMLCVEPKTKEEYREEYAKCVNGIWYWNK